MKNIRLFLIVVGTLGLAKMMNGNPVTLTDNFDGSSLNSSIWTPAVPYSDSSVAVSGGNLVLTNRGRVVTNAGFSDPLDVLLSFEFTGNQYDSFKIALRTDGTSTNASGEFNSGIFASFRIQSDPSDPAGTIGNVTLFDQNNPTAFFSTLATGTFVIGLNQPMVVRFLDTGSNVSLFINDLSTPFLTGYSTDSYGSQVGLDNREGAGAGSSISAGSQVKVDFVSITSNVPDGGATIIMLGLAFAGMVGLRRRMGVQVSAYKEAV